MTRSPASLEAAQFHLVSRSHCNLPAHQARQQQVAQMLSERFLDEAVFAVDVSVGHVRLSHSAHARSFKDRPKPFEVIHTLADNAFDYYEVPTTFSFLSRLWKLCLHLLE